MSLTGSETALQVESKLPAPAGRLPTIARNVLTAIFLFDPATPAALEIGAVAHQLEQQASLNPVSLFSIHWCTAIQKRGTGLVVAH